MRRGIVIAFGVVLAAIGACGDDGGHDGETDGGPCNSHDDCPSHLCGGPLNMSVSMCVDGRCQSKEEVCGPDGSATGDTSDSVGSTGSTEPCGPGNCEGCCDSQGNCRTGVETSVCGQGGEPCIVCGDAEFCASPQTGAIGDEYGICTPEPYLPEWVQTFAFSDNDQDHAEVLFRDPAGHAVVVGMNEPFNRGWLGKLDEADGTFRWRLEYDERPRVGQDDSGNLYVAETDDDDLCTLHRYDPEGTEAWSIVLPFSANVAMTPPGNPIVFGEFDDAITLGVDTLTPDGMDAVVAELDATDGTPLWATQLGGAEFDFIDELDVAPAGELRLLMDIDNEQAFGPDTVPPEFALVELDASGAIVSGAVWPEHRYDLATDPSGALYTLYDELFATAELERLDDDAAVIWTAALPSGQAGKLAFADDGTIFAEFDGTPQRVPGVASYDTDGSRRFFRWYGPLDGSPAESDENVGVGTGIVRDPMSGDVYLSGRHEGEQRFVGATLPDPGKPDGRFNGFVVYLRPNPAAGL